ncbi:MAG: DinB family protein [Ferruginibacter sp.]
MPKPIQGTYPPYFQNYINFVTEDDVISAIKNQQEIINSFFDTVSEERSNYAYAEGKWTLKELLQHVIDTERIFNFRALAFARKESQSVPGFEEADYAANSNANARTWKSLCEELKVVRKSSQILFENFTGEMLSNSGLANNNPTTVNALGFILVGHVYHHKNIMETRYL